MAHQIARRGYRAVLPDLRGHGRSSGDFLSYGVVEARDLSQLIDALDHAGRLVGKVGVVGTSYGAATAIELAALDPRVVTVLAIAPFSSLYDVVPAYVHHYAPLVGLLIPAWFIAEGVDRAGRLGDFDPHAASPLEAIAKTHARVLLVHGRADTNIPLWQSEALHRAAADHSRLIVVDGADHFSIVGDPSGAIANDGMAWLDASLGAPSGS